MRLRILCSVLSCCIIIGICLMSCSVIQHAQASTAHRKALQQERVINVSNCNNNSTEFIITINSKNNDDIIIDTSVPEKDAINNLEDWKSPYLTLTPDGKYVYEIQAGDTLCSISEKLNVPLDILAEHNGIRDVNLIYDGAILLDPLYGVE